LCVCLCVCVCFCRCVCVCVCLCAFVYLCVTTHVKPARDHLPLGDLKISMFLSLSFSLSRCVRVCYTRAHACRSSVPDLPSQHTPCARGGGGAGARVFSRAHKMRGPALINVNDCSLKKNLFTHLLEKGSYASYTISLHKNPQNHNVSTAVHRKLLLQGRAPCLQHMVHLGGPRYSNMYVCHECC
jgi:hypothetical protein